ncbi:hypothetical protein CIPAW_07G115300 [Carya illinoinensis]|uniref:Uncharacterized protein n=1 Tax=Carya illinoinensis TaxID=32201 RepID=A0A8T1Q259_CARIL|nr:hypothetical protein CIPAW_07G115300 [Carya illinoinensis]
MLVTKFELGWKMILRVLCNKNHFIFMVPMVIEEIRVDMAESFVAEKRHELIEVVSEVDDQLAEAFLNSWPVSPTELEANVCCTLSHWNQ